MLERLLLWLSSPILLGGAATLLFGRRTRRISVPGLLFHSVLPQPRLEMSHFPLKRFEKLCALLSDKGYRSVAVRETPVHSPETGKPVLLTFDDGLQTVCRYALPVMERYGFRATVFCIADFIGKNSSWDVFSSNLHCSRADLRSMAEKGHEIGSHTSTHAYLPFLDDEAVERELSDSKKKLEDLSGSDVTSVSFPYGGWNRRIWEIALESGYTSATLYRDYEAVDSRLFPVSGVYLYDSVWMAFSKIDSIAAFSVARAGARMFSHFAKGSPVWKYRKEYKKL